MGYGRNIPYAGYDQPCRLKGAYSRLSAGAGALDEDIHLPEAVIHPLPGGLLRGPLGGEGGALP